MVSRKKHILFFVFISILRLEAQKQDSVFTLKEVQITNLEGAKSDFLATGSVSRIRSSDIKNTFSFSPAAVINQLPGIRLEERSPNSYRLNIRGSTIRSPFGVRNVKVYWNSMPLSDPTGNTYFNAHDLGLVKSIEILRGPAASGYGNGYGGVVDIKTHDPIDSTKVALSSNLGSFGSAYLQGEANFKTFKSRTKIGISALSSDGYREHTQSERINSVLNHQYFHKKAISSFSAFYGTNQYQTPGGLTGIQNDTNRLMARPGVKQAFAGIYQETFLATYSFFKPISTNTHYEQTVFYGKYYLRNPALTSYERRPERQFGLRGEIRAQTKRFVYWLGYEWNTFNSVFKNFTNNAGNAGEVRFQDEVNSYSAFVYFKSLWKINSTWSVEGAINRPLVYLQVERQNSLASIQPYDLSFSSEIPLTTKFALQKVISSRANLYLRYSNGFSTPTAAEIVSTIQNSTQEEELKVEYAHSWELGAKWHSKSEYIKLESVFFLQNIRNALSRRLTANDQEYFINANTIQQRGWENSAFFYLRPIHTELKLAYTWNNFVYKEFLNANLDFSGNKMPGVPKSTYSFLVNSNLGKGIQIVSNLQHIGSMYLEDANKVEAKSFFVWDIRFVKSVKINKVMCEGSLGVDNVLDTKYSSGSDFNAFGGRYYNPSLPRLYFLKLQARI
ncbi:MAG: TonB-dependent receptor [Leadbetterella sp.]